MAESGESKVSIGSGIDNWPAGTVHRDDAIETDADGDVAMSDSRLSGDGDLAVVPPRLASTDMDRFVSSGVFDLVESPSDGVDNEPSPTSVLELTIQRKPHLQRRFEHLEE